MTTISRDDLLALFRDLEGRFPDSVEYQRMCTLNIDHPITEKMIKADPFSSAYAEMVMELYLDIRGSSEDYHPDRDEISAPASVENVFSDVSPWSFKDPTFISEFLFSWGQIMRSMALPSGSPSRILEYGSGSGQFLLFLARSGLECFAVDIDVNSLNHVREQADAMGIEVQTERAAFGGGFDGQRFDRILFFEAFHHAAHFMNLLTSLHDRLTPDGSLVFSGEPIVPGQIPSIPYPWGPRLDALSTFCINRYGWMELGFTRPFFVEALHRTGWFSEHKPFPGCGRADTTVARPFLNRPVNLGADVELGRHAGGWSAAEGKHRCSRRQRATLPLPTEFGRIDVEIVFYNPLPIARTVLISVGSMKIETVIAPCVEHHAATLHDVTGGEIAIDCVPVCIDEIIENGDDRFTGAIVRTLKVTRTSSLRDPR